MTTGPRTIFIGDVHGCADELQDLLRVTSASRDDHVVFVGDLVAKGPDSQRVVQMARELGARAVRGNHDESVLRYRRALRAGGELPRLKRAHEQVVRTLREPDWAYLEALPAYLELPELEAVAVHAGIVPGRPLAAQELVDLITMRTVRPDGSASSKLSEGVPWASRYGGPAHVVFGHDAVSGIQQHPFATGLDSGCVYGGALTALVVPPLPAGTPYPVRNHGRLVSVNAHRVYEGYGA